jgi:hypothetical protein
MAGLLLVDDTFFGATTYGGEGFTGALFSLPVVRPTMGIVRLGANVILTWPADQTGYSLQFRPSFDSQTTWGSLLPAPVLINGQFTVTDAISSSQRYYRLTQ